MEVSETFPHLGAIPVGKGPEGIALDRFVGDLLPVQCAGVVKAAGRALVARGLVAVEIADPARDGEER